MAVAVVVVVVVVVGVVREAPLAGATDIVTAGGSQRGAASVSRVVVGQGEGEVAVVPTWAPQTTGDVHTSTRSATGTRRRRRGIASRCMTSCRGRGCEMASAHTRKWMSRC